MIEKPEDPRWYDALVAYLEMDPRFANWATDIGQAYRETTAPASADEREVYPANG